MEGKQQVWGRLLNLGGRLLHRRVLCAVGTLAKAVLFAASGCDKGYSKLVISCHGMLVSVAAIVLHPLSFHPCRMAGVMA